MTKQMEAFEIKNDEPKTLAALRKALMTTNGVNNTVAVLYGSNDNKATCSFAAHLSHTICAAAYSRRFLMRGERRYIQTRKCIKI